MPRDLTNRLPWHQQMHVAQSSTFSWKIQKDGGFVFKVFLYDPHQTMKSLAMAEWIKTMISVLKCISNCIRESSWCHWLTASSTHIYNLRYPFWVWFNSLLSSIVWYFKLLWVLHKEIVEVSFPFLQNFRNSTLTFVSFTIYMIYLYMFVLFFQCQ